MCRWKWEHSIVILLWLPVHFDFCVLVSLLSIITFQVKLQRLSVHWLWPCLSRKLEGNSFFSVQTLFSCTFVVHLSSFVCLLLKVQMSTIYSFLWSVSLTDNWSIVIVSDRPLTAIVDLFVFTFSSFFPHTFLCSCLG